jgi:hypothetical protein
VFVVNYYTSDQQENRTEDFLQHITCSLFKSLPSSRANSSKLTEKDNGILIFDNIKEGDMKTRVQNELSDISTHGDEDGNKMKAVLTRKHMVCSIETCIGTHMLRKLKYFA